MRRTMHSVEIVMLSHRVLGGSAMDVSEMKAAPSLGILV